MHLSIMVIRFSHVHRTVIDFQPSLQEKQMLACWKTLTFDQHCLSEWRGMSKFSLVWSVARLNKQLLLGVCWSATQDSFSDRGFCIRFIVSRLCAHLNTVSWVRATPGQLILKCMYTQSFCYTLDFKSHFEFVQGNLLTLDCVSLLWTLETLPVPFKHKYCFWHSLFLPLFLSSLRIWNSLCSGNRGDSVPLHSTPTTTPSNPLKTKISCY